MSKTSTEWTPIDVFDLKYWLAQGEDVDAIAANIQRSPAEVLDKVLELNLLIGARRAAE